jgi:uncharacterized protein (DUF302 family)
MTIYQANRREVVFDVTHAAFSAAFEALLGRTDVGAFADATTLTAEAARERLASFVGPLDFSLFQKIDHGALRTTIAGKPTLATTYVFGNALIAVQMTTHDARAGLYVPLRLFVQEIARNRVMVTYDLPSAAMRQFEVPAIDDVARSLDDKVQRLLDETIARASSTSEE